MAVRLEGGAEWIEARFYSPAFTLLERERVPGPYVSGWNRVSFPGGDLPPGLVFYTLIAGRSGRVSVPSGGKLYRVP
jgi:hypothetical protein